MEMRSGEHCRVAAQRQMELGFTPWKILLLEVPIANS